MEWMKEIVFEALLSVVGVVLTAVIGRIVAVVGKGLKERFSEESIMSAAYTVVGAVEMMYREAGGEEKMQWALSLLEDRLKGKGIDLSREEMRLFLESAVAEWKRAFREA